MNILYSFPHPENLKDGIFNESKRRGTVLSEQYLMDNIYRKNPSPVERIVTYDEIIHHLKIIENEIQGFPVSLKLVQILRENIETRKNFVAENQDHLLELKINGSYYNPTGTLTILNMIDWDVLSPDDEDIDLKKIDHITFFKAFMSTRNHTQSMPILQKK